MRPIDLEPYELSKLLIYMVFYKGHALNLSFMTHDFVR